jgi:hypothetical protein
MDGLLAFLGTAAGAEIIDEAGLIMDARDDG